MIWGLLGFIALVLVISAVLHLAFFTIGPAITLGIIITALIVFSAKIPN